MSDVKIMQFDSNLYNQSFGENPAADQLLGMLSLKREDFGRYRDIFVTSLLKDQRVAGYFYILVYTRIGGNNKADYPEVFKKLGMHPQIVLAWDDKFDSTYHYIQFRVPDLFVPEAAKLLQAQGGEPKTIHEKFDALEKEMKTMTREQMEKDPRFAQTIKMFRDAGL